MLPFEDAHLTIQGEMVNEFLHYDMCGHRDLPSIFFSMVKMKASPFVHIEPREGAVHSRILIDLACDPVKVFGINVLLDVEMYRPHGELFGHLLTDALHRCRIRFSVKHFDDFPGQIRTQRLAAQVLEGDFFATLVGDLLFLYDHGLDRRPEGEKGALQLTYRRGT
jgi:hypothetical protein